jgi:hypothetical protein
MISYDSILHGESMRKTRFKQINIREEAFNKIEFMAKSLGKSKNRFLEEIINSLFDACSEFEANMNMFIDVYGNRSYFTFSGKSCIMKGSFSMPTEASEEEVDAKVKEEAEKAFEVDKNGE